MLCKIYNIEDYDKCISGDVITILTPSVKVKKINYFLIKNNEMYFRFFCLAFKNEIFIYFIYYKHVDDEVQTGQAT